MPVSGPVPGEQEATPIAEYNAKITKYGAALEAGADPRLVSARIAEARADRERAVAPRASPPTRDDEILGLTEPDLERNTRYAPLTQYPAIDQ